MEFSDVRKLNLPDAVKDMSYEDLDELCSAVRKEIIETVAENGGHLASSLGCVELTVALLKVFDPNKDKVIWDVGHQSYAYKILTDRAERFSDIRKKGGISGFPKPEESHFDAYATGHSGCSVSAAFGISTGEALSGSDAKTVAIIGDASFTNGMVFEALNHLGNSKKNLVIVLNDNGRSIAKNHGAFARYLLHTRTRTSYYNLKKRVERFFKKLGIFGKPFIKLINWFKRCLRAMFLPSTLFESLGVEYLGPIDGHDIEETVSVFKRAQKMNRPVLVHLTTVKGKGYEPAVLNPENFHGVPGFDIETGILKSSAGDSFSTVFGRKLSKLADNDDRICAITAAMEAGTGLNVFKKAHQERFFDVGIAEEHAVSFACGLAKAGMKPVFAVYSAFLQRAYDQLLIEAAFQKLPVVFAIDRAGIVGEDGETHQGVFDVSYISHIPNIKIYAPFSYDELEAMLEEALAADSPVAIRYPRGKQGYVPTDYKYEGKAYHYQQGGDILTATYGRTYSALSRVVEEEKLPVSVLKLNSIKPFELPDEVFEYDTIVFFEESAKIGGIAEQMLVVLNEKGWRGKFVINAIGDSFIPHSTVSEAMHEVGLDEQAISGKLREILAER